MSNLVINFTGTTGIIFTAWPEMLAWPYLMLQGWLPYRDIAIAHNPLLLFDLAIFFKLFGVGINQLKIYTWLLIGLNTCLTYFVTKKFWDKKMGFVSSILYLLLSIVYEGNGIWFDLSLAPFAILLYYFLKQKNYLWIGIIFALGFLTKQTFVYFAIPIAIATVKSNKLTVKKLVQFILGLTPVFAIFILYLIANNLISDYYNWAIKFGIFYLPNTVGQVSFPSLKQFVFGISPFLLLPFTNHYLLITFALVGAFGVYPRWELFHFQPALPFLAITISSALLSKKSKLIKYIVLVFTVLFLAVGLKRQFGNNTRFYEPEVVRITQEIRKVNTGEIYIINYWDNIYALTNTVPATKPLIPYIPWYLEYAENKKMIINDLKLKIPERLVVNDRSNLNFTELELFLDRYYSCNLLSETVELCYKNK